MESKRLTLIGGPCVIESEEHVLYMGQEIKKVCKSLNIDFVFKSSFDKANRTSIHSYRGPGFEKGLEVLKKVKEEIKTPILTDIHEPYQAKPASKVVDIIQIPAFLCRQTDLLLAAAETGISVNVKKGQFLAPGDMTNIIEKLQFGGAKEILLTERGSTFGYNNLVVDFTSIIELKKMGYQIVFDATHSVQKPGGKGNKTGGNCEYVPSLAKAAVSMGVEKIFMEIHDNPKEALSDGPNMLPLKYLKETLTQLKSIFEIVQSHKPLFEELSES